MIRSTAEMPEQPAGDNLAYVEEIYNQYLANPTSVPEDWRRYFRTLDIRGQVTAPANQPAAIREMEAAARQDRVDQLIRAFRVRGHLIAKLDPLDRPRPAQIELEPSYYGFRAEDLDAHFSTRSIEGANVRTLKEIVGVLQNTYCKSIGVQFMHIDDPRIKEWLQRRMEGSENRLVLGVDEQKRIFTRLTDAVIFEEFIQKKYTGAKTFSLEGAESLIPLLDLAVERAGNMGVEEIIIGMAHRGRLNVLANIIGKSPQEIFLEFEDSDPESHRGRGDVKYHLGYSNDWTTQSGRKVHLSLSVNPSHLEYVNPVALGRARARQDRRRPVDRMRELAILIHGDAAFIGEGVVQECLNLSQLDPYTVGGTVHIIVNNQIGFTTSPSQAHSCTYNTDVAKMLQIPIFHVNGEHPEAVAQVIQLALDFRHTFQRDVVVDMYCFRRRGHNESDEPAFTQPLLYKAIDKKDSVRESYLDHLLTLGGLTFDEAEDIARNRKEHLEKALSAVRGKEPVAKKDRLHHVWDDYIGGPIANSDHPATLLKRERIERLMRQLTTLPPDFKPHPKLVKELKSREEMGKGLAPFHWAAAESLAFASLAEDGRRIRMTGQDVERGTFSHRHAVLHNYESGETYTPLKQSSPNQAPVEIHNSPLSESGVLGFEYGYSLEYPDSLVLWEAQFGDFCNTAQVIIDQFIVSAEDKWSRLSGLVLLLPHGFEGSGPEHSSARLERFLDLAAEDNIQVMNLTTPGQYFHALRQQALRRWIKPLVIMTPKSLLRNPRSTSPIDEFTSGSFQPVLSDNRSSVDPTKVSRILLCTGKIFFDLEEYREKNGRNDVAIVRLECLYPTPEAELAKALSPYPEGTPVVWVQEEPENMGAWRFLYCHFRGNLWGKHPLIGVSRPSSASPATGSSNSHKLEQREVVTSAFADRTIVE